MNIKIKKNRMKKLEKIFSLSLIIFAGLIMSNIAVAASGWNIDSLSAYGLPEASIYDIVSGFLYWILEILGIVGVIGFALSGVMYLISAGNEDMIKTAKKAMVASITGVIVGLSGLVIIWAVTLALDGMSF